MIELTKLSDKLIGKYPESEVKKYIAYLDNVIKDEAKKEVEKRAVSKNTNETLYGLATKFFNMGITIDGINAVVTGYNMVMVTYHGYKNAVLKAYPESEFDTQLVREGDTFTIAKESGSVVYSHTIADPFNQDSKQIIGAYAVIKTKRGEYFEALNKTDFEQMKSSSKMGILWKTWESEFWLKSVIKRACKRHFYDIVADIDKSDNEDFGLEEKVKASEDKKAKIIEEAKNDNNTHGVTKEPRVEKPKAGKSNSKPSIPSTN